MTSSTRFRMNRPKVVHETFDDNEVVMINLNSGSYYNLNKAGTDIWRLIEDGSSVSEIAEVMAHVYDSSGIDIESAVKQFLEELVQEDLIVPYTASELESFQGAKVKFETEPEATRLVFQAPALKKYTDMQELLLLDPIHEVDETGWPKSKEDSPDESK